MCAIGCALSFASVARADQYDATFTRAIAAKERALDLNDPAAFEQALDLFQQADRIRATKESKYELGSVASRLRQDDLAVESYEAALALGLEGTAADKARAFVQEKSGEMARVSVKGPAGTEVFVGARRRGSLPLSTPLVVFAGKVRVRAIAVGREIRRELELQKGQNAELDLENDFASGPPSTPPPAYTPPVFTHPPVVTPPPEPDRTAPLALTIGGASVVVISVGTLILSYSQLSTHRDRLKQVCAVPRGADECDQANTGERAAAQDEVDSIATYKSVRTIGFVGLGAGLVAGGIGIAWLAGKSASEHPTARAFVAPTSGGLSVGFGGTLPTW